jgi:hypothetical protein
MLLFYTITWPKPIQNYLTRVIFNIFRMICAKFDECQPEGVRGVDYKVLVGTLHEDTHPNACSGIHHTISWMHIRQPSQKMLKLESFVCFEWPFQNDLERPRSTNLCLDEHLISTTRGVMIPQKCTKIYCNTWQTYHNTYCNILSWNTITKTRGPGATSLIWFI